MEIDSSSPDMCYSDLEIDPSNLLQTEQSPLLPACYSTQPSLSPRPVSIPDINFSRRMLVRGQCPLVTFCKLTGNHRPKHEYFLAMVIRGLKKAIKFGVTRTSVIPATGLFRVIDKNPLAAKKWNTFLEVIKPIQSFLIEHSKTDIGAAADLKKYRNSSQFCSFNKRYIRHFYESPYVRVAHYYFTEWLFAGEPEAMSVAMKLACCEGTHDSSCIAKWASLKDYVSVGIIKEVDLLPYSDPAEESV